jgi:surfeit locus 1 family protein
MAKGQSDQDSTSFVPTGLKVRRHGSDHGSDVDASSPGQDMNTPKRSPQATVSLASVQLPPLGPASATTTAAQTSTTIPPVSPLPTSAPKTGFRPMPVLSILTLICLGILWMLGSWQWDKFVLKSRTPTAIAAAEPVAVAAALEGPNPEYRPVTVEGLIDTRIIKISTVQDAVRGYRIFSPVVLDAGGIFVDRGFVAEDQLNAIVILSGQVNLQGVVRLGARPNAYTPDNDPASDVWYWPDLPAMAANLGIASMAPSQGPAYYVSLTKVDPLGTGDVSVNPYADSKGANQIPPERHLGYALTWWGFGLALIGVYIGLHARTGRLGLGRARPS